MLRFDNRVVVITGSGRGIGLEYAKFFASRGAKLVLNDLAQENGSYLIDRVAMELANQFKTEVHPNHDSVEFGEKIIEDAVKRFGRVDVLINNAGILRDKSFIKMTNEDWDLILKIHMTGSFRCTHAAWKIFRDQKYGRIINTSSSAGLNGNFGQVNYSAAKAGLHGFTRSLSKEGEKYNIKVNTIAPIAATQMTQGLMPEEVLEAVQPKYVIPLVALLCHEDCPETGGLYEVGGGWVTKLRWQRAQGVSHKLDFTPEDVKANWSKIIDFSGDNDYPESLDDTIQKMFGHFEKQKKANVQTPQEQPKAESSQWKSSEIFKLMKAYVEGGLAKNAVKKCNALFQFDILDKKDGKVVYPFYIDIREGKETAGQGAADKPDATFVMTDDDFFAMCMGKLNPQMAFIKKQMKIRGNFKKASSFTPDLFPQPTKENIEKYTKGKPKL